MLGIIIRLHGMKVGNELNVQGKLAEKQAVRVPLNRCSTIHFYYFINDIITIKLFVTIDKNTTTHSNISKKSYLNKPIVFLNVISCSI